MCPWLQILIMLLSIVALLFKIFNIDLPRIAFTWKIFFLALLKTMIQQLVSWIHWFQCVRWAKSCEREVKFVLHCVICGFCLMIWFVLKAFVIHLAIKDQRLFLSWCDIKWNKCVTLHCMPFSCFCLVYVIMILQIQGRYCFQLRYPLTRQECHYCERNFIAKVELRDSKKC